MQKFFTPKILTAGALVLISFVLFAITIYSIYQFNQLNSKINTLTATNTTADTNTQTNQTNTQSEGTNTDNFLTTDQLFSDDVIKELQSKLSADSVVQTGPKGDKGDAGASGLITELKRFDDSANVGPNSTGSANASCDSGWSLLSGGCRIQGFVPPADVAITNTYPAGSTWFCDAVNNDGSQTINLQSAVICYK